MILKTVDNPVFMWDIMNLSDLFLTTTNATVSRKTGRLVMGAGHALQTKQRVGKNIDKALAKAVEEKVAERMMNDEWKELYRDIDANWRVYGDYYLLVSQNWPAVKIGALQTKRFFKDNSDGTHPVITGYDYTVRNLVDRSTYVLGDWCRAHPDARVDMPFPGIGAGGCPVEEIMPLIERLPDTVYVWRLE